MTNPKIINKKYKDPENTACNKYTFVDVRCAHKFKDKERSSCKKRSEI